MFIIFLCFLYSRGQSDILRLATGRPTSPIILHVGVHDRRICYSTVWKKTSTLKKYTEQKYLKKYWENVLKYLAKNLQNCIKLHLEGSQKSSKNGPQNPQKITEKIYL